MRQKILSFSKALPLQIHPDKALAEILNRKDPGKFTDSNHKPEIAIALSQFELFVGWKPLDDIQVLLKLKPLERYIPQYSHLTDELLKEVCKALLTASPEMVKATIRELQTIPEAQFGVSHYIPQMLFRLSEQYSESDNGNLVATLLMNYITLKPGDAVCVPADSIHAYLEGDILECMARSDNVLNTGFCPTAERDSVELFTRTLTFKPHSAREAELPREKSEKGMEGKTDVYAPPISEFNVLTTSLGAEERERHKAILGPSLMIVTEGSGKMGIPGKSMNIEEGYIFFVGQSVPLEFSTEKGMTVHRAYAE
jgi:mannose-6-phosphate isomerase